MRIPLKITPTSWLTPHQCSSIAVKMQSLSNNPHFRSRAWASSGSVTGIPTGAWDSHMHVIDTKRFPLLENASYKPHDATLHSAIANADRLKLPNLVFVQPSVYGTDNSCLLEALKAVGPRHGRGIVVFDPRETSLDTLQGWHTLGVRGVRLNLKSVGKKMSQDELAQTLREHADAVRPMKTWVLQLYVDLAVSADLEPLLPELGIKVVLDHYGSPPAIDVDPSQLPGWHSLIRMMQSSRTYVKISAPYRLSQDPSYKDLECLTKELLNVNGGRSVVFASDWPHTRFEGVCVESFAENCLEWCDRDETLVNNLFRDNARELWDVK